MPVNDYRAIQGRVNGLTFQAGLHQLLLLNVEGILRIVLALILEVVSLQTETDGLEIQSLLSFPAAY